MAIEQGLMILNWHENLQEDERPPEYLWEDAEGLDMWWKTVDAKRKDGVDINRGAAAADHDGDTDQGPQQTENDHARFLKQAYA